MAGFLWVSLLLLIACIQGGSAQTNTNTTGPSDGPDSGSGAGLGNTSSPVCKLVSDEFQFCVSFSGRMSTYQYEQFLPQLNGQELTGNLVQISFTVIETFSPPPPEICTDAIRHLLCYFAAPPCDPVSDQQLPICNDSCMAYKLVLDSDLCREFNNSLDEFTRTSTLSQVQEVYGLYTSFDCANSSAYYFREGELASGSCSSLFTPGLEEQIFSRTMCVPVPTGLCTVASETGHYVPNDRDSSVAFLALAQIQSMEELSSFCTNSLLKLVCDYVFQPCNPETGHLLRICDSSCPISDSIFSECFLSLETILSAPEFEEILNAFRTFNCSDPSSYLIKGVPIEENVCVDLTRYVDFITTDNPTTSSNIGAISAGVVVTVVALLLVVIILLFLGGWVLSRRKKKKFEARQDAMMMLSASSTVKNPSERYQLTMSTNEGAEDVDHVVITEADRKHFVSVFSTVLVPYSKLSVGDYIGEGAFGKVYRGAMQSSDGKGFEVAIKTIKNLSSQNELKAFFTESLIMKDFNHPNVLGLVGVCFDTPDDVPYIILPFMVNGSLKDYLKKKRVHMINVDTYPEDLELKVLVGMCIDITHGMDYLAEKKFVHRDLAARNCMVSETLAIRVGDFGLARDVYSSDYYRANRNAMLPVKWMPPETLHDGISNEKTDVWSFGVTCWEVFSLGRTPYPGVENHDMIKHISSGGRLERPTLCPEKLYHVFATCWEIKPEDRPTFSKLVDLLQDYYDEEMSYVNDYQ